MKTTYYMSCKAVSKSTYYAKRNFFRDRYFVKSDGTEHISNKRA